MDVTVEHRPSYAIARVRLGPGEQVRAEAGAMVTMREATIATSTGGLGKALKRTLLGGESFFQNTFTAGPKGGEVQLAPALPGDIAVRDVQPGESLIVQDTSYLGSEPTVEVDTSWQGLRGALAGESFVQLRVAGRGKLLLTSYGAIQEHALAPGETLIVDTGHIVAFTEGTAHEVRRVGNLKSTLLSGEGLVVAYTGPGRVWTQTRSVQAFLAWLMPHLPGQQR